MKKQLTILLLFLFNCTFICGQKIIKTDTPCDKELLKKTPGEWMPISKMHRTTLKSQLQQIEKRLAIIHQWVKNIYPSPMAFDAIPSYRSSDQNFAAQVKIENTDDRFNSYMNGIGTISYSYSAGFCDYHCGREPNEIMLGRGCETGTNINADMNTMQGFFWELSGADLNRDMIIDGRPIRTMPLLKGKWKGYDLYAPQNGSGIRMVLLHREGMLPYIPVTRKQYLDRSIEGLQKFFDKIIKSLENPVGLATLMDKKEKDEQIKKQQKFRDDVLKYYQDELDATTKAGLLDTPAIIFGGIMQMHTQYPLFQTQADGGRLLVTENPAYIKKDLPKYIPQLIIYSMWNGEDGPDPSLNPYYYYYQDFPIEKLKAMIDK
ncbi:MAG TPA: hypothetical protein VI461_08175 [Chitinophagaceae bacterium]|nr:hypothetical protein [Chitinophagaceae bacterium]